MSGAAFAWQPRHGGFVHLARRNPWQLESGRYRLDCPGGQAVRLVHPSGSSFIATTCGEVQAAEAAGTVTPISAADIARDQQELALRLAAPLRGNRRGAMRAQLGTNDLDLFGAAAAPQLF